MYDTVKKSFIIKVFVYRLYLPQRESQRHWFFKSFEKYFETG